jgi:hypothetical protein
MLAPNHVKFQMGGSLKFFFSKLRRKYRTIWKK